MRPIQLEIEGLTSFRERTTLDLESLDLFAITGPTGAGKTSVVDAMLWALFGQVPRVGKEYRQLLSHGSPRVAVRLDFGAGSERYRVARSATAKGRLQVRLERLIPRPPTDGQDEGENEDEYDVEPLADRAIDVAAHIERIVGLDYQAFVRAVVLPQGEFDRFLKGEPGERRAILASLLDLHVYERMAALARRQASQARSRADLLADQLTRDFARATIENLARAREDLGAARGRASALREQEEQISKLATLQRTLDAAQTALDRTQREHSASQEEARAAAASREEASSQADAIARSLDEVDKELAAAGYDDRRLLALARLRPQLTLLLEAQRDVERLAREAAAPRDRLVELQAERQRHDAELAVLEAAATDGEQRLAEARDALDHQRQQDMASALRADLHPGDPCPVCERPIERVPATSAPGLDDAQTAVEAASRAYQATQQRLSTARQRAVELQTAAVAAQQTLDDREARLAAAQASVTERQAALLGAEVSEVDVTDPAALAARLEAESRSLESHRERAEALRSRRQALERSLADSRQLVGAAEGRQTAAEGRLRALEAQLNDARSQREASRHALDAAWPAELPHGDLDAALRDLQRQLTETAAVEGRLALEVEHIEQGMTRAAEITQERDDLRARADTAHTLARALQADAFMAFVQEEALQRLAADGTSRLASLSHGRYSLRCVDDEFVVVDHWNADTERSVRTLSGGETFLASLALALALADRVTELCSGTNGQVVLESLFLDEGFGTLDADALDVAASALESLQDGHRMVGVITHLDALAERLPTRVVVAPSEHGATLSIVSS